jgi:hypothetical protein
MVYSKPEAIMRIATAWERMSWSKYSTDAIVKGNIGGAACPFVMGIQCQSALYLPRTLRLSGFLFDLTVINPLLLETTVHHEG